MVSNISRDVTAKLTERGLRFVEPVPYLATQGLARKVYDQVNRDFRMLAGPFTLHASNPSVLAGAWSITRETLTTGKVDRSIKEAVATAVSKANECPYCVGVHTGMLHAKNEHKVAAAIMSGDYETINDPKLRAIVMWALATKSADSTWRQSLPFATEEAPEIIGTALAFHYLNRMVNIFLADSPISSNGSQQGWFSSIFGATLGKRVASARITKGESLSFLPAAQTSRGFSELQSDRVIAGAFSRFDVALDEAVKPILSDAARSTIQKQLDAWYGQSMGISTKWTEEITAQLDEPGATVARLALLTAFASYQVDTETVRVFRSYFPEDAQLIALTGWASFAAARRIGEWLDSR